MWRERTAPVHSVGGPVTVLALDRLVGLDCHIPYDPIHSFVETSPAPAHLPYERAFQTSRCVHDLPRVVVPALAPSLAPSPAVRLLVAAPLAPLPPFPLLLSAPVLVQHLCPYRKMVERFPSTACDPNVLETVPCPLSQEAGFQTDRGPWGLVVHMNVQLWTMMPI